MNRATQQLASLPLNRNVSWTVWENLQMQKILRMIQRFSLVASPARVYETTDAAFICVSVGRLIARLRNLVQNPAVHEQDRACTLAALASFRHLCSQPTRTALILRTAAQEVMRDVEERPAASHVPTRRIAACLEQASLLVDSAPGFFHKQGPLQLPGDMPGANNRLNMAIPPQTRSFGMRAA